MIRTVASKSQMLASGAWLRGAQKSKIMRVKIEQRHTEREWQTERSSIRVRNVNEMKWPRRGKRQRRKRHNVINSFIQQTILLGRPCVMRTVNRHGSLSWSLCNYTRNCSRDFSFLLCCSINHCSILNSSLNSIYARTKQWKLNFVFRFEMFRSILLVCAFALSINR